MNPEIDRCAGKATVFFDGGCPLCRTEIQAYQQARGGEQLSWVDASVCPAEDLGQGLSRSDALARLHVRQADGSLVSGASAFMAIWAALPRWRWLALLARIPGALTGMDACYGVFLKLRRLWRHPT